MEEFIKYVTSHQFTVIVAIFCAFFITWFLFKKLFKLALFVFLLFLVICGYFYWKNPDTAKQNIESTLKTAEKKTVESLEKGITTYNKGKEYMEKGKKKIEDVDRALGEDTGKTSNP